MCVCVFVDKYLNQKDFNFSIFGRHQSVWGYVNLQRWKWGGVEGPRCWSVKFS